MAVVLRPESAHTESAHTESAHTESAHTESGSSPRLLPLLQLLLIAAGVLLARRWAWVCDDAFISFRYAKNLVDGHGLVFNIGPTAEVVEGYTNALWTLWIALGLALDVPAETWSMAWGVVAYAALIATLVRYATVWWLPLAAVLVVVSRPLQIWATGGLETAANLALLMLAWQQVARITTPTLRRSGVAGGLFALATMTRPDSLLIACISGVTVLFGGGWSRSNLHARWRPAAAFAGIFAAIWLPFSVWRVLTYGDFFPNTYYAKSAQLWWLDQGAVYVGLFIRESPLFVVGCVAAGLALLTGRVPRERRPRLLSALAICVAFTVYVMKVGGGFMHTRLLLPALPFAWVVTEEALLAWTGVAVKVPSTQRVVAPTVAPAVAPTIAITVAIALALAVALTPPALTATEQVRGIVDERAHYDPIRSQRLERDAHVLRAFLSGLAVRAAYIGGQARLIYRTEVDIAIEAETGLTDRHIAHQPLQKRGRIGHEKHARPSYLVNDRKLHLVFGAFAFRYLGLEGYIPKVGVRMGHTTVFLVTWDAELMAELKKRGAKVPPFEQEARRLLADPSLIPVAQRQQTLASLRRFWPHAP